jgi:hypothetical protein
MVSKAISSPYDQVNQILTIHSTQRNRHANLIEVRTQATRLQHRIHSGIKQTKPSRSRRRCESIVDPKQNCQAHSLSLPINALRLEWENRLEHLLVGRACEYLIWLRGIARVALAGLDLAAAVGEELLVLDGVDFGGFLVRYEVAVGVDVETEVAVDDEVEVGCVGGGGGEGG